MTVSMRVMTAGSGYRYLLSSVVTGDGDRDAAAALTRYYNQAGTPPGWWAGSGLSGLAMAPAAGSAVSETQLRRLLGEGRDPDTGEQLGRPFRRFATVTERVAARVDALPADLVGAGREAEVARIQAEEAAKPTGAAVAGFDFTFSVPKSVSSLWAVADAGTQEQIVAAHHAAIRDVLDLLERDAAMTRVGAAGPRGAVAQVEVRGIIATGYDHYDSRAADPQLHTHVVVANRVQGARDGKWRTLDSRALHGAVVGISEHYNAVLSDHLTATLGVAWEQQARGADRSTRWEIAGIPTDLTDAFSSRTHDIERVKDELIADYVSRHGRHPSNRTIIKLRQQATLQTRPKKQLLRLAELTRRWRERAAAVLGEDAPVWATRLLRESSPDPLLRADDIPLDHVAALAEVVVAAVGDRRATWKRWNLHAEAVRQSMDLRFASPTDRDAVLGLVVDAAEQLSIQLTPDDTTFTPAVFRQADGASAFRPKASVIFSSETVLAAEERLLTAGRTRTAPTTPLALIEAAAAARSANGHRLGADQAAAITKVAVSALVLDVLVGPAGAGKTTAMNALRRAWEHQHGPSSVLGLAPSAAAADVLAGDLGIPTENTAMWLHQHTHNGWTLKPGQLVIIDEASLAGTMTLDTITSHADQVGAKILLVGDHAQLAAVDTGGAFGMLVGDRDDAPELLDVRRFVNDWEKAASLRLRLGDTDIIDTYLDHGRIHDGTYEDILDAGYQAWRADIAAGKTSILIAETRETVSELNARARTDRIADGTVHAGTAVRLTDGNDASAGDLIITRKNQRRLTLGRSWVKNGDRWEILRAHTDGALTVRRAASRRRTSIVLPATYVAENVDLGYAITAHRAQGSTVDTAHTIVHSPQVTRESLYVAMTRGRQTNMVYVATDEHHLEPHQHRHDLAMTARSILYGILQHVGAETSAHQTRTDETETWGSLPQLAAEYDTLAQEAQRDRWSALLRRSGLADEQMDDLQDSDSFGVLTAELRRLESQGHNVDRMLPAVIAAGKLADVEDLGSLLRYRMQRLAARYSPTRPTRTRLIAGLIPAADGPLETEMQRALHEREQLMGARIDQLTQRTLANPPAWMNSLTARTASGSEQEVRLAHLRVILAYRDRWGITATSALGTAPDNDNQRIDYERARTHLNALRGDEHEPDTSTTRTPRRDAVAR